MIDIKKQVAYWREGAAEDWAVASDLVNRGNIRHGLFFAHLALEKVLKAHVCVKTLNAPPRIHNLVRLAETAGLVLDSDRRAALAELNAFALAGRYPETLPPAPSPERARAILERAEETFKWLMTRL
jgi:HEPN domain-containing protein